MTSVRFNILIFSGIIICSPVCAQSYSPQQITLAERIESAAVNAPPEIAYIQTSKDIYETGEDLWFKVYLLDAQTLIPSLRSKTLYLQLLEETSKKPVWEEKYEIQNGFSNGSITLSGDLKKGEYLLAAYTPFSFYGDTSEFKAVRRIRILEDITTQSADTVSTEKPDLQKLTATTDSLIQFNLFPEGGDLVSGIQCKLAFKAVNKSGEPIDVKGTLFEDNNPIIGFSSSHAGMGSFNFTPDINKKYIIRLSQPTIDSSFVLPGILPSGMTMQLVSLDTESIIFKVTQSPDLKQDSVYLRIQIRGVPDNVSMAEISKDSLFEIPLSGLSQGIAEVTLFNSHLEPVAERLVYINQYRNLSIATELLKESYLTRGKVTLKISVKDEDGWPVSANLGVTVFDKIYQNSLDSSNILSHIFFSSQLKGRIFNPSFYFNSKIRNRDEALDLLMLTQGWRRYVWNEKNLIVSEKYDREIISDGIPGVLYYPSRKKKIPQEETFVMAFSPNFDSLNVVIPADTVGRFAIDPDLLRRWENDYVYLKPFGSWGSGAKYKKINPEIPEYALHIKLTDPFEIINSLMKEVKITYPDPGILKKEVSTPVFSFGNDIIEIEGVTIRGHREKVLRGKYMRTLDSLVKYDLYHDFVCEWGFLNCPYHTRDDYGSIKPIPGDWYLQILGAGTPAERVIRTPYLPPKFSEDELLKMSNLSRVKAYSKMREFYEPNYDKNNSDNLIPDFRNTLLWAPSVFTDTNGEATLSFFCSDINSVFVGRIEGVGGNGLLGAEYFSFSVRKTKNAKANGVK